MSRRLIGRACGETGSLPDSSSVVSQTSDVSKPVERPSERWRIVFICVLLAAAVWVVFGQTRHHEFVNFDTDIYVYDNDVIAQGLGLKGIVWAFTHFNGEEWWPLTSISHMLDCQLFGLEPGGHHLTNVLLHGITVILLFLVLRNMTGALWRSAFVAVVFAIHPLRAESVAWVSERKDVLSGLFFVLTLGAYVRYVRRPFALSRYLLVLFIFALGLMSKAMLVTMPFVLLLLDYWPLRRIEPSTINHQLSTVRRLILEKIPFVLLAVGASLVTILAVHFHPVQDLSISWRIANAVVAYAAYLGQMIYPVGLAVFYPHPANRLLGWVIGMSVLVLVIISAVAVNSWRKRPYFLVGWLWYLAMLVPVIGILQVGSQARADRYTYLPQIGLYLLVAWGAVEITRSWRYQRAVLRIAAVVAIAGLGALAHRQTAFWHDSISLWKHTIHCTPANALAHYNLGNALVDQRQFAEAIQHYQFAVKINPNYTDAHNNLGNALATVGRLDEAIPHFRRALQLDPDIAEAHGNLGAALAARGKTDEAVKQFQMALELAIEQDDTDLAKALETRLSSYQQNDAARTP